MRQREIGWFGYELIYSIISTAERFVQGQIRNRSLEWVIFDSDNCETLYSQFIKIFLDHFTFSDNICRKIVRMNIYQVNVTSQKRHFARTATSVQPRERITWPNASLDKGINALTKWRIGKTTRLTKWGISEVTFPCDASVAKWPILFIEPLPNLEVFLTLTLSAWLLRGHTALKSILCETLFLDQLHDFSLSS